MDVVPGMPDMTIVLPDSRLLDDSPSICYHKSNGDSIVSVHIQSLFAIRTVFSNGAGERQLLCS